MDQQVTLSQLKIGDFFYGHLLVKTADERRDKRNKTYIDLTLCDRSGEINCKLWNEVRPVPRNGNVCFLSGNVEEFNGRLQLRANDFAIEPSPTRDMLALLVPCAPREIADMRADIDAAIGKITNPDIVCIVRAMLEEAGPQLDYYPAAQRMHHAERGGLLHHTTDMLRAAEMMLTLYPGLNGDLVRAGIILHDLGKLQEMEANDLGFVSDYSREGILMGHLVLGVANIANTAARLGIQGEVVTLLQHMVIAHHSIPEYGSPKPPMFPEAELVSSLDALDARMNEMFAVTERTPAGVFSEPLRALENRRIYHPTL